VDVRREGSEHENKVKQQELAVAQARKKEAKKAAALQQRRREMESIGRNAQKVMEYSCTVGKSVTLVISPESRDPDLPVFRHCVFRYRMHRRCCWSGSRRCYCVRNSTETNPQGRTRRCEKARSYEGCRDGTTATRSRNDCTPAKGHQFGEHITNFVHSESMLSKATERDYRNPDSLTGTIENPPKSCYQPFDLLQHHQ
jgi:hypothetical protein